MKFIRLFFALFSICVVFCQPSPDFQLSESDDFSNLQFGYSVALWNDTLLVGGPYADFPGKDAGCVYYFKKDSNGNWNQLQKLVASDSTPIGYFGKSISIYENTAVICGPEMKVATITQGACYFFSFNGSHWVEEKKLFAADGADGDKFGDSVSLYGNTVFIGAPRAVISGRNAQGAVYVFTFNGINWNEEKLIVNNGSTQSDQFGISVSLYGNTAIVGTVEDSAFVYSFNGSSWLEFQKLVSDGEDRILFGVEVKIFGNFAIVGAKNDRFLFQGSVFVFNFDGTSWNQFQKLTAQEENSTLGFGSQISLYENKLLISSKIRNASLDACYFFSFDGSSWNQQQIILGGLGAELGNSISIYRNTSIIGAYLSNFGGKKNQGSVFEFSLNGNTWNQTKEFSSQGRDSDGSNDFGYSVDLNGEWLVVGSPFSTILIGDTVSVKQGIVFIFKKFNGSWVLQERLVANDGNTNDNFGNSVSLYANTTFIGAYGTNIQEGVVYVFTFNGTRWNQIQKLTSSETNLGDRFGNSISVLNNTAVLCRRVSCYVFNFNGTHWIEFQKLVPPPESGTNPFQISAELAENVIFMSGRTVDERSLVYVFNFNGSQWVVTQRLFSDNNRTTQFGTSMVFHSNSIIIGDRTATDSNNNQQGAVYVFKFNGTYWNQIQKILLNDANGFDQFGKTVSAYGNNLIIGAPGIPPGAAYLYSLSNGLWFRKLKFNLPTGESFGFAAVIYENTTVIGAPKQGIYGESSQGVVYIYDLFKPTNSESTTSLQTTSFSSSPPSQPAENKISSAAIIGIVFGILFVILISLLVAFILFGRKRKGGNEAKEIQLELKNSQKEYLLKPELKIGKEIGKGNFGIVYKGTLENATVACKELKEENKEIGNEIRVLSSLKHPNIVAFIGMKELEGKKYIVMEFMNHGSLLDYLRKHETQVEELQLFDMAKQICLGMAFLEENNVIHKDLALRNVLCNIEMNRIICKVSDFGLSRILPQNYNYYVSLQKKEERQIPVKWSAPEVLFKERISSKCDVFSFGVVLFEIFSKGRIPWAGMTNDEVIKELENQRRMPFPNDFGPQQIKEIISKCWEEDPHQRPTFRQVKEQLAVKGQETITSNSKEEEINYN